MRITGTLLTIGTIHECGDETVAGLHITASDDELRNAASMLGATVDIYPHIGEPHCSAGPDFGWSKTPPLECTPENFAHLQARLAHAEDHLAREVRSSQASLMVARHRDILVDAHAKAASEAHEEIERLRILLMRTA